ncbi:hypothetical protein [Alloyangia pacifica]|uniref:hypothetical protein n=1 Tax=Alloyangia pacifica TaxID=311180 RepID=UPI001CFEC076|nr:hypothetical protein [Alloyangia pacifica]
MANTTIGRLRVILGADSSELDEGLSRAKAEFKAVSAAVAGMAAAAGTAMLAITRQVISGANEIQQFARVANAAPEEFQKWAAATSTVGIEQDKLADILKDVNDRVGDFLSTGGGPMADFFENIAPKVGVTAEQFRNLSGPQALQLYIDSLQKAGVSQGEMTFYLEAMASDLTMMLPLLKDGGAEMDRLGDRAEALGAVLDSDTIASMRRTQVAISEIGLVFKGIAYEIARGMTPVLEGLATAFSSLAVEGAPLRTAFNTIVDNLGRLAAYGATAVGVFGVQLAGGMIAAKVATMTLAGALSFLRGALIRTGVGALIVGAGELVYQFGRLVSASGGFGEAMSLLKDVALEVWERIKIGGEWLVTSLRVVFNDISFNWSSMVGNMGVKWGKFLDDVSGTSLGKALGLEGGNEAAAVAELNASLAGLNNSYGDLLDRQYELKKSMTGSLESVAALRSAMQGAGDDASGAADAAARIDQALNGSGSGAGEGGADKAGAKAKEKLTELEQRAEQAGDSIRGSLTDAFKGIATGAKSMGEAVSSVLSSLSDMLLTNVGNALFSGISSSLGTAIAGSIPGYANGTNNHPGGLAWVGERGRELVNLPRGSQVIPHQQLRSLDRDAGQAGMARVEIVPSPYFDSRVVGISQNTAGPMVLNSARAQQKNFGNIAAAYQERGVPG